MDRVEIAFNKIKSHLLALQVAINEEHIERLTITIKDDGYFNVIIDETSFFKTGDDFEYIKMKDAIIKDMEGLFDEV